MYRYTPRFFADAEKVAVPNARADQNKNSVSYTVVSTSYTRTSWLPHSVIVCGALRWYVIG